MTRKWERMVAKNSKNVNKQREKYGRKPDSPKTQEKFKGRGWLFPTVLAAVGIMYMILFASTAGTTIYWVTVGSYLLLALIFFFRRPFIEVKRNQLTFRRWNALKFASSEDIKQIMLQNGAVIIVLKKNKSRWIFSRLIQRYDTDAIAERLKEFARAHGVALTDERNSLQ